MSIYVGVSLVLEDYCLYFFFGSILILACVLQALPGQQTPENCPSFKLVIVGDGGTGQDLF